jgi:2-C-methyl-D-erythritol 2,4-cyclodiphosphate synthase
MQQCIAQILGIAEDAVSIKATTTETMGFTGREEGLVAMATCLLAKK